MPTGTYRNSDGFAQVDYDGSSIPVSRPKYEKNGLQASVCTENLNTNILVMQSAQDSE
jgi:hypothetical protein